MPSKRPHFFARLTRTLSKVEPSELTPCALSFFLVFILMCAYYSLRPFRDALASDWSDAELSALWTLNFFISALVVTIYGFIVSKLPFHALVPSVYGFFAASFAFFYFGLNEWPIDSVILDKAFYLWMSVFSLFNISVFWSYMADIFSKEQSGRLFPVIGAGASAGALTGPAVPTLFADWIGADALLLVAALLMLPSVPIILILSRLKVTQLGNLGLHPERDEETIGGNPFAGFLNFFSNPYLLAIGLFIVLYTAISSIVYFQQKNLLEPYDLNNRTVILGAVDWVVNILSFTIAFFVTGRIVKRFGLAATLSCLPFFMVAGLSVLAVVPYLSVVLALQVARRAGNYAITRPAREMLFTKLSREDRFKSKPVIDIVVYRGGDMVTGWGFAGMTEGLGFGLSATAAVGALIAAIWGWAGIYLGRQFQKE